MSGVCFRNETNLWPKCLNQTLYVKEETMVIRDPKQGVEYDPMATQQGRVRVSSIEATAEVVQDQLKRGKSGRWEIICDEGPSLGGVDVAPTPLQYFAMAVLF